jgi:very-short-patch-repair endonuclease
MKYLKPFDFYIPKYSMCVEFDGIQHSEPIGFFGGQSSLERNKIIDKIKSDYCLNNNIRLIRINYKNIKKINSILDEIFKTV